MNTVATYSFIKPQKAGCRSILQGGFDLLYTPLLECRRGAGRILYCQLDITNRYASDPVATLLVTRMLETYSARSEDTGKAQLVSAGEGRSLEYARLLGYNPRKLASAGEIKADDILLIHGADEAAASFLAGNAEAIAKALNAGARLLFIKASQKTIPPKLPLDLAWEEKEVFEHGAPEDWPLLRGLCASDFYWRRTIKAQIPSSSSKNSRALPSGLLLELPVGKGKAVFLQADDDIFHKPYDENVRDRDRLVRDLLKRWVRVKIYRVTSNLLDNMGAPPPSGSLPPSNYEGRKAVYVERGEPFNPAAERGW